MLYSAVLNQMLEEAQAREMVAVPAAEPVPVVAAKLKEVSEELKGLPNWVWWRKENGTKVPFVAGSFTRKASSTDPASWRTFDEATKDAVVTNEQGIGFVFRKEDGIVGIDLDGCRNPNTGELAPWAAALVTELNSFTEITPSQTGLHILVRGALPEDSKHVFNLNPAVGYGDKVKIEVFDEARYFTVTGDSLFDGVTPVEECDLSAVVPLFEAVKAKYPAPKAAKKGKEPSALNQNQPVQMQRAEGSTVITTKKNILMHGTIVSTRPFIIEKAETSLEYPSQSEADFALVSVLAMENADPAWIDEQFRASVLMRAKWERLGESTIQKALKTTMSTNAGGSAPSPTVVHEAVADDVLDKEFPGYDGREMPEIPMLVEGFLPKGVVFFGSLPGVGKTWVGLSLAKALTTVKPLFGVFPVKERVGVLYLIPEASDASFKYRLSMMKIPMDKTVFRYRTISQGSTLSLVNELTLAAVKKLLETNRQVLVIVDTAVRFMTGKDENASAQNNLSSESEQLRAIGADVLFMHHAKKDSKKFEMTQEAMLRGTGDFAAMADAVYGLRRDEAMFNRGFGPEQVEVECVKPRDMRNPPLPFRLEFKRKPNKGETEPVSVIEELHDLGYIGTQALQTNLGNRLGAVLASNPGISLNDLCKELNARKETVKELADSLGWKQIPIPGGDKRKFHWSQVVTGEPAGANRDVPADDEASNSVAF
jgi:hypothetical protein